MIVSNTDGATTVRTTKATTTTTTTGRSGLQTYGSMTTPTPNRLSDSKRDRLYNILRRSKKTQTFPLPSAPTSTSIGQQTSTPLALASNKLTSAIPLTGITSDTTLLPTKAALIPVSSSLSSTSQIATVQQSTPVSQQRIGTVTNFCIVSNISFDNT